MKFTEFLTERYLNFFIADKAEREKYKDEVYDLIQKAYANIGGIKGSGFESADDMVEKIPMWKLIKRNGKIVAGSLYKDKNGRKSVCVFTDGQRSSKIDLAKLMNDDGDRAYKEVSSKALAFTIKSFGLKAIKEQAIPVKDVKALMPDEEYGEPDKAYLEEYPELAEFFYARKIGGSMETKIALGTAGLHITGK